MNKIPSKVYSYLSSIQQVKVIDESIFFITKNGIFLYIPSLPNVEVFSILDRISFTKYCKLVNSVQDSFQLFQVLPDKTNPFLLLKDLYFKSRKKKTFDLEKKELIYRKLKHQFHSTFQYYYSLQDKIEEMYYPRKNYYDLILRMSDIYQVLRYGEYYLDVWYSNQDNDYLEVLTVRNLSLNNYLGDSIVDVSRAKEDFYIYELANYYFLYYSNNVIDEIDAFFLEFASTDSEKYFFYSLISLIPIIDVEEVDDISSFLLLVDNSFHYLSEKYKENQEREKEVFKEE